MMQVKSKKSLISLIMASLVLLLMTACTKKEEYGAVANAGWDQYEYYGDPVTLDGSGSYSESDTGGYDAPPEIISYEWKEDDTLLSTSVEFTKSDFSLGVHTITLTVKDNYGDTASDDVLVYIVESGLPVADAGEDKIYMEGDLVILDGSGSYDPDGTITSFEWIRDVYKDDYGPHLGETYEMDWLSAGNTYTYILTVTDDDGYKASDEVTITVLDPKAPVADAGPDQTVIEGTQFITLDGTNSVEGMNLDGEAIPITEYIWTIHPFWDGDDPDAYVNYSASASLGTGPILTADMADLSIGEGTFYVLLRVIDAEGKEDVDGLILNITPVLPSVNTVPVADAGEDQTVSLTGSPVLVTLDGSGSSDVEGDLLTYEWSMVSMPACSTAVLSDDTAVNPTFLADINGSYVARLLVNDGTVNSLSDDVTINVLPYAPPPANLPPIADAGADQSVVEGTTVTLDGSGSSDTDGTITTYEWTEGSTILSTNVSFDKTDFSVGIHTLTLTVTDDDGASASDDVNITVTAVPVNIPPVADAGADQSVIEGTTVTLDGSGSSDTDGTITTYEWTEGSTILSTNVSFDKTDFSVGVHTITLIVTDDDGATASDDVNITVTAVAPSVIAPLKTGQVNSYDKDGALVLDGSLKDDGFYQKGITPDFSRDSSTDIVTDNLTGLMWQDDASVSSVRKAWLTSDNFFTCFSDNTSPTCYDTSGDTASTYCSNLTLGAFNDWRLPSRSELANIVNYGSTVPAIDNTVFLNIGFDTYYWSSTTYAETKHYAWFVDFIFGAITNTNYKNTTAYVRCVREGN